MWCKFGHEVVKFPSETRGTNPSYSTVRLVIFFSRISGRVCGWNPQQWIRFAPRPEAEDASNKLVSVAGAKTVAIDFFSVPSPRRNSVHWLPLLSEDGTIQIILMTFLLKMAQAKARIWPGLSFFSPNSLDNGCEKIGKCRWYRAHAPNEASVV